MWLLLACAGDVADSGLVEDPICAEAPVTTWDNFGSGFVVQNCQTCHASTSDNRLGAPEEVVFDTKEDVWEHADRVLARSVVEADMPPQGGVTEEDRERLDIWLTCADEGT
ncbi:MAG: hypothetical protein GY913_12350 [Proteobacteria bacterium]|nr:hypothetical protein [Pseudomonadota bacterium]